MKNLTKGSFGQANHLNQSAAYLGILERAGGCIELDGNALVNGTEHNQYHQVIEEFLDPYRKYGPKFGQLPTNKQVLSNLHDTLSSVIQNGTTVRKFSDDDVNTLVDFAEKEQIGNGYFDGGVGLPPRIPGSMNLKYGGY